MSGSVDPALYANLTGAAAGSGGAAAAVDPALYANTVGAAPDIGATGGGTFGGDWMNKLPGALAGASKAFNAGQPQGSGQPGAPGAPAAGRGSGGQLQALLQMLMARQQAYQQAAQTGAIVPQTAKMNQPGLLGV